MIRLKESMQTVVTAMKNPKMHVLLLKILLVLLAINYQVVTVICKDFVLFKFLRDIVLMCLAACVFYSNWHTISLKSRFHTVWVSVIAVFAFLVFLSAVTKPKTPLPDISPQREQSCLEGPGGSVVLTVGKPGGWLVP